MTNVYGRPGKYSIKARLFEICVKTLQNHGWIVERVPGSGKASLRKITKGRASQLVSIRTTQDTWIAFPRNKDDTDWVTLSEADAVVAVSVNDAHDPKFANVHMISGDEMRDRFNRAYTARRKAGHRIPIGRGVWVALYFKEASEPTSYVGAGAGLKNPPIAKIPLDSKAIAGLKEEEPSEPDLIRQEESPLSIAEAKRRLALALGVDAANIRISVEA